MDREAEEPGRRKTNRAVYRAALKRLTHSNARLPQAGDDVGTYPIVQALKYLLEAEYPQPGPEYDQRLRGYRTKVHSALTLARFWQDKTIADATVDNRKAYYRDRQLEATKAGIKLSTNGRKAEIGYLRRALKRFIADYELKGSFDLEDDTEVVRFAREAISRDDLARLLWAARGRKWDSKLNRWNLCPPWHPDRLRAIETEPGWGEKLRLKNRRRHVARCILLCAYTTSFASCVTRLRWKPKGDASYVALDVDHPQLFRLGKDAREGRFAGEPVLLNRRITAHLKRWHAMDEKDGFEWVIHYGNSNRPLMYPPTSSFTAIRQDAGVSNRIRMDDLRFSAGAHIAETEDMVLRSGALLMGLRTQYFLEVYGHLASDYQQVIMDAFDKKPGGAFDGFV